MLAHNLEIDRARNQARVNRVLPYAEYEKRAKEKGQERPNSNAVLLELLRDLGLQKLQVPADFPPCYGRFSAGGRASNSRLRPTPLFPQRKIKDAEEIEGMRRAMRARRSGHGNGA